MGDDTSVPAMWQSAQMQAANEHIPFQGPLPDDRQSRKVLG